MIRWPGGLWYNRKEGPPAGQSLTVIGGSHGFERVQGCRRRFLQALTIAAFLAAIHAMRLPVCCAVVASN